MSEFKVGDVVELKSGSPFLTVVFVNKEEENVSVVMWDENRSDFKTGVFDFGVLKYASN